MLNIGLIRMNILMLDTRNVEQTKDVIEILQLEDSTRQTLTEMTSTTQKIHYASYEKKKGTGKKQKFQSNSNSSSSSSSGQKQDSTGSQKLCYWEPVESCFCPLEEELEELELDWNFCFFPVPFFRKETEIPI